MNRSRAGHGQAGYVSSPLTLAVAAVLLVTVCGLAWFALHPPHASQAPKLVLPSTPADRGAKQGGSSGQPVPAAVQDSNARMRLRYAWLAATDWARDHHQSFSGLSPGAEQRLLRHSGVEVILRGEGRLVLTRFNDASRAGWGVVSVRVAHGRNLLLVTRSKSGRAFCFVQKNHQTGIGAGDVHGVGSCSIRWG
jgi:hypothetical protein